MRRFRIAAMVLAGCVTAANADPLALSLFNPAPMTANATFYFTTSVGAIAQQLPTFTTPYTTSGRPLFSSDATVTGPAGSFTVGRMVDMPLPGRNTRIEFTLSGFTADTTIIGGQGFNGGTTLYSIAGTNTSGCGGCDGTTTVRYGYNEIGGTLALKTDLMIAPLWTLTPSAGLLLSRSNLNYESHTPFYYNAPGFTPPAAVNETLTTWRTGAELGLNLGYQATPALKLNAAFSAALYSMSTDFDGKDCFSGNQSSALPCNGSIFATVVTQSDTRFGSRERLLLSAIYDIGWSRLSIMGFSSWDDAMPGVVNPTTGGVPAQIKYEARSSYGGAAAFTMPLDRFTR
ncbi:MAG: hypothetical protein HY242_08065 [Afipia sp.]|nr:hypothetical protein [Afipia sp.]